MSRTMQRLRDWPECLKRLTLDDLRGEREYWRKRLQAPCHREARKGMEKYVRDIEKEMDRRESEAGG
jgi:hypothetical protein